MKPIVPPAPPMTTQSQASDAKFDACASTASLFLYAQGSAILCLHHDTLALECRFESHQADVRFICVDNVSERGAGRLVVSYDTGKTAIVWDLFTGSVIARFASFEELQVAAWMRNGNVAFGNAKGDVILFEPSTSEHISCRTIFDPITALAPAIDCRTYSIGYQNGSILIATLHPTFSILHTMSTARGPSPIVQLAWHASSSKQKSDMLATLSSDGDLRVWSVAKPPGKEAPRVIRVLKRSDVSSSSEPKWMAWSKNGKIIQYLDGETWAWDVKTKHVTYEPIPTVESPRGLASYGPTATLFTLGPQYTVQQYDVDSPAMVANVRHVPPGAMPAPLDEARARAMPPRSLQDPPDMRESGSMFPAQAHFDPSGIDAVRQQRAEMESPVSSRSHANSVSSKASSDKYRAGTFSPPSRSGRTGTSFSLTSASERDTPQPSNASYAYAPSVSMSSVKSSRAGSRLKNEIQFSPADNKPADLFPFTRARLNEVPYGNKRLLDEAHLNPDDLRRQMLSVVFGWNGDIGDLIQDELSRHRPGSHSAVLLAQWIGQSDADYMVSMMGPGPASVVDWMLLAFSQMNGESQANKVGQAFVQKLLEAGDVHTAATILLGIGDKIDAIEVYVSQNYFMEAILMTCLVTPTDWQRQSYLVRRWGEHVVSHSQQQLAIRCFMCTGVESSDPWSPPAAQQVTSFAEAISGRSPMTSPEPQYQNPANLLAPSSQPQPTENNRPLKTPALKLITSFDSQPGKKFRFPGLKSDDRTPTNAPGVTPIAESAVVDSALSPGGFGSYKLNNVQSINNAMGSRTGTPGFNRRRLPSIGETPVDVQPPSFPPRGVNKSVDYGSTSENEELANTSQQDNESEDQRGLLSATRYDPEGAFKPSPQTAVQATADRFATIKGLPSPAPGVFEALQEQSNSHNGSRDRKPDGLSLRLSQGEHSQSEMLDQSDFRSPASTLNSYNSARSPSVSGRSIDPYISSLDEASYRARKHHRQPGRSRRNTDDSAATHKHHTRNTSQETRGRDDKRYVQPAKRSPSSPVPMSSEEIMQYSVAAQNQDEHRRAKQSSKTRSSSRVRKPRSRNSSERRKNRSSSRARNVTSGRGDPSSRGRSEEVQDPRARSPSSPVPMSSTDDSLRLVTSDRERLRTRQRSSSRRPDKGARREPSPDGRQTHDRSHSHHDIGPIQIIQEPRENADDGEGPLLSSMTYGAPLLSSKSYEAPLLSGKSYEAPMLSGKSYETSKPDNRTVEVPLLSGKAYEPPSVEGLMYSPPAMSTEERNLHSATAPAMGLAERKRKQLAAAELEARRLSLARNPSAPNIPFPGEAQIREPLGSPPFSVNSFGPRTPGRRNVATSKESPEYPSSSDSSSSQSGGPTRLPTTPKAMRHPRYNGYEEAGPPVSDGLNLLSDARYQEDAERIGRSMSVPVPESQPSTRPLDMPMHPRFNPNLPRSRSTSRSRNLGHHRESREFSGVGGYSYGGSPVSVSIEETIENAMLQKRGENPPLLPELQHLNPPPPPPPPIPLSGCASPRESSGTIDIAIDNENMGRLLPRAMTAAPALSVETRPVVQSRRMSLEHRRGKSVNESFTSKIRNLTRMGSTSRPSDVWVHPETRVPYETVAMSDGRF
ncbi:WD domain protein [Aspergillus campestris IBT 28561]|uniref:WD domain protein n=1 Tax=Aspergillus campestris (strain IBT 28561) TaxID=1392248 RepID=A0A2I1CR26_ASPC2|nr:WD domain protein [Aspergillus campestris IBT 28561]PKY00069.1 WD domain protein [Aspergillus campestris IBT 28561]